MTKNLIGAPLRRASWLAAIGLALAACGGDRVREAREGSCAAGDCWTPPACAGDAPEHFCDDCNPCTDDANCTPCSALPPADRDMRHCTADDELPPFCAGRTGCVHVPRTTPEDQINDCFPVAGDPDLHAGQCLAGACVENAP